MHGGASIVGSKQNKPVVIGHLRLDHALAGLSPSTALLRQQRAGITEPRKTKKTAAERVAAADKMLVLWRGRAEKATGVLLAKYQRFIAKHEAKRAKYAPIAALTQRPAIVVAAPSLTGTAKRIKEINAYLGSGEYALSAKRLAGSPMTLLIEKASAKGEELMAAQEIELAFMALAGGMMFKPLSLERGSPGRRKDWSDKTSNAVEQYRIWADHWSKRKHSHLDHTLECVIAAVIDQRPIRAIGEDLGFHHRKIERAVLCGLRDYAARAGWVDGKIARAWMDAAEDTFRRGAAA